MLLFSVFGYQAPDQAESSSLNRSWSAVVGGGLYRPRMHDAPA